MPKSPRKGGNSPAQESLPEQESCDHREIIADPQVAPADAKGCVEPAEPKFQRNQHLRQLTEPTVQGLQKISAGPEEHAG